MAHDDVYPSEMKRQSRLDESTIDQILAGSAMPSDEFNGLVAFVEEIRQNYLSHTPQVGPALASLLADGLIPTDKGELSARTASNATGPALQVAELPKRRTRKMIGALFATMAGKVALAGAATAATVGSLGAAGALPGPMQSVVADTVSVIGFEIPDPDSASDVAADFDFKVDGLLDSVDDGVTDVTVPGISTPDMTTDVSLPDVPMSAEDFAARKAFIKEHCDRTMAKVDGQYAKQSSQIDNKKASGKLDEHYKDARDKVGEKCTKAMEKAEEKWAKFLAGDTEDESEEEPGDKADRKNKSREEYSEMNELEKKARENERELEKKARENEREQEKKARENKREDRSDKRGDGDKGRNDFVPPPSNPPAQTVPSPTQTVPEHDSDFDFDSDSGRSGSGSGSGQ